MGIVFWSLCTKELSNLIWAFVPRMRVIALLRSHERRKFRRGYYPPIGANIFFEQKFKTKWLIAVIIEADSLLADD